MSTFDTVRLASRFATIIALLAVASVSLAQGPTTTTLSPAANTVLGSEAVFTATVTGSGSPPTGIVSFIDGLTMIGTAVLNPSAPNVGTAIFKTSLLPVGPHSIVAQYSGGGAFDPSISSAITHTVARRGTTTVVSLTPASATVRSTKTVAITLSDGLKDAASGTFTESATTVGARRGHANAVLPNGLVAIFGGDDGAGAVLQDTVIYDLSTDAAGTLPSTVMSVARTGHSATALQDGRIFIVGGSSTGNAADALISAEIYDPITGLFSSVTGALNTARTQHTATLLANGLVLIAGGFGPSGAPLDSLELFDPVVQSFTTVVNGTTPVTMLHGRGGHAAVLVLNGTKLLFAGGDVVTGTTAELFDIATSTSIAAGDLQVARVNHTGTLLPDGNVLITGGGNTTSLSSTELYDVSAGTFVSATGALATSRMGHTATMLNNGRVLIAGGFTSGGAEALASAELYTPSYDPVGSVTLTSLDLTDTLSGCTLILKGDGTSTCDGTAKSAHYNTGSRALTGHYAASVNHSASDSAATTLTIDKVDLTITATSETRTYDGTTTSLGTSLITSGALLAGDEALLTQAFDSRNAGARNVIPAALIRNIATQADVGQDYNVIPLVVAGTINQLAITVTAAHDAKVYDGALPSAGSPTFTPALATADSPAFTQAYVTKDVGNGKAVVPSGTVSDGNGGQNYSYTFVTDNTGIITPKPINATVIASNKIYDATNAATISTCSPNSVVLGDSVSCNVTVATFSDKNVATSKTVTANGISLSGGQASNYAVTATTTTTADITPATLTVTATGKNKTYDGTTTATVTLGDDHLGADIITLTSAANFNDKTVGATKPVTVSGIAITGGSDGPNYKLANTTTATTADITTATLIVSLSAADKVYNGDVNAQATLGDNRVPGDTLTITSGQPTFPDKNAGVGRQVTAGGIHFTVVPGDDSGNYQLGNAVATSTATITPAPLPVTVTVADKIFDNTDTASATAVPVNPVPGDDIRASVTSASFVDANAAVAKSVNVTVLLVGGDSGNYKLQPLQTVTATINPAKTASRVTIANATFASGAQFTLAVRLTPEKGGTPDGTATFVDDVTRDDGSRVKVLLGTVTLQSSTGALLAPTLAAGAHRISITYAGGPNYVGGDTNTAAALTIRPGVVVSAGQPAPPLAVAIHNPTATNIATVRCVVESAGGVTVPNTGCTVDQPGIAAGATTNFNVTITTLKQQASLRIPAGGLFFATISMALPGLIMLPGLPLTFRRKIQKRKALIALLGIGVILIVTLPFIGCGGNGFTNPGNNLQPSGLSNSTPAGSYVVMVYGSTDQSSKAPLASIPLQVTF